MFLLTMWRIFICNFYNKIPKDTKTKNDVSFCYKLILTASVDVVLKMLNKRFTKILCLEDIWSSFTAFSEQQSILIIHCLNELLGLVRPIPKEVRRKENNTVDILSEGKLRIVFV